MKDMTKGSPIRLILGFAIPLFFGMLFQQFYNLVDMIIVGRFLGIGSCGCGCHRFDKFYDHRFLYGSVQWICHPGCAEIRSQR